MYRIVIGKSGKWIRLKVSCETYQAAIDAAKWFHSWAVFQGNRKVVEFRGASNALGTAPKGAPEDV